MQLDDPRVIYIALVLPTLFAVTLSADGFFKIIHANQRGVFNLIAGLAILGACLLGYAIFSNYAAN